MRVWSLLLLGSQSSVQCTTSSSSSSGAAVAVVVKSTDQDHSNTEGGIFAVLSGGGTDGVEREGREGGCGGVGLLAPDVDKPCGEMHVLEVIIATAVA